MLPRPLAGLRVLVTRPSSQSADWVRALEAAGATALAYPTIRVEPPSSFQPLDDALADLARYDWIVFTSAAAVRFTLSRFPPTLDLRSLDRPRVAAVGPGTAHALAAAGLTPSVVPADARQEGLLAALGPLPRGTRVLFPQAVGGRELLREALGAAGCSVDVVPASRTVAAHPLPVPPAFDVATFASPSALNAFLAAFGTAGLNGAMVAVIGPTTAAAASAAGLQPVVVAEAPTAEALISAIAAARGTSRKGAP